MTDALIAQARNLLEGQIDFEGQRKAELLTTYLLAGFGAIAFIIGYILSSIHLTLYLGLLGTVITFVLVVPAWGFYNRDPERWLPGSGTSVGGGMGITVDGKRVG